MSWVGKTFLEDVPAGTGKTVKKVTRILSEFETNGQRFYRIKVMTPGFGAQVTILAETIEKKFPQYV